MVSGSGDLLNAVMHALATVGVEAKDVQFESATLEDAFVRLTRRPREGWRGVTGDEYDIARSRLGHRAAHCASWSASRVSSRCVRRSVSCSAWASR